MSRDLRPVVNLAYQPVASGSSVAMIPEVAGPKLEFNSYPLFALVSDAIWEAGTVLGMPHFLSLSERVRRAWIPATSLVTHRIQGDSPVGSGPLRRHSDGAGSQVARFSGNGSFQILIACDSLTVDRREVTIEAGPQLGNRGRRRVSRCSAELGISSGSEPGAAAAG